MSRIGPNPTSRTINNHDRTRDAGESLQAQPIRPDDYDDSRVFDRKREMKDRPALDRDPRLRM
jgi:hypothetical protein